jgi:hypothetical protein
MNPDRKWASKRDKLQALEEQMQQHSTTRPKIFFDSLATRRLRKGAQSASGALVSQLSRGRKEHSTAFLRGCPPAEARAREAQRKAL